MIVARIFGPLEIVVGDRCLGPRDLGGLKPKQVMQILLLARGRTVPKERLADHLWGEALPRNVHGALETYVSRLRRELGEAGRDLVVTEPSGYRVDASVLDLDLDRFDALTDHRRTADLGAALELVRGDVLEDEPYADWATGPREAYGERVVRTLLALAEAYLDAGDPHAALELAERAIERDAVREAAHRAVMRALQATGERDQALRAYERCRSVLAAELGVDPDPATNDLHVQILRDDRAATVSRGAVAAPPDERLPLIGRDRELQMLVAAARTALAGAPTLVLLEGEPGVGKTRLMEELLERTLPAATATAKCFELDRDVPFVALATAVRDLLGGRPPDAQGFPALGAILPELGDTGLPAEAARARGLESLLRLLADRAPVVLAIDDLQWADPSTVAALSYLRRRAGGAGLLIVGAYRADAEPGHPVRLLDADARIALDPLGPDDVATLGVAGLYEQTGGNALFVVECMRAIAAGRPGEVSSTLRDMIIARCRSVGAEAHRVIAAASILSRSFDPGVLASMMHHDDAEVVEHLEVLRDHGLLTTTGDRFDFRHDLIRETLSRSLSDARRRILHRRALDVLTAAGADAGEIAPHAVAAGSPDQAVRYSMSAGDLARSRWANAEAAAHYERALRFADEHPVLLEAEAREMLLLRLARVLVTLGRGTDARALAERARDSASAREDEISVFEALEVLGTVLHRGLSRPSLAIEVGQRALDVAERIGDDALRSRGHMLVGAPGASLGLLEDAMRHYHAALELAGRSGRAPAWPLGRIGLALHHLGRAGEAVEWCGRAEAAAIEQHDEETVLMARWVKGLSLAAMGRYEQAWRALESVEGIGKGEEVFWHARFPNAFGSILADCCLWERALERDLAGLAIAGTRDGSVREAWAQTMLNVAGDQLGLGAIDEARRALDELHAASDDIEYARFRWESRLYYLEAEVSLAEGDVASARSCAMSCLEMARRYEMPKYKVRGDLALAGALVAAGERQQAVAHARRAAAHADRLTFPAWSWRAWWAAATISGSARDLSRARRAVLVCADGLQGPLRDEFLKAVPVEA